MTRLKAATTSMSHQNGMRKVLIGGAPPLPLSGYWPSQEMMPKPIR